MGGFLANNTENQAEKQQQDASKLTLRELMSLVFGCAPEDCFFKIENICDNSDEWLQKYKKSADCGAVTCTRDTLSVDIAVTQNQTIPNIKIKNNGIHYNLMQLQDHTLMIKAAFSMAILAKAHPEIRKDGATLAGEELEQLFLFLAAQKAGVTINEKQAEEMAPKAAKLQQHLAANNIDVNALWAEHCHFMNETSQPSHENKNQQKEDTAHIHSGNEAKAEQEPRTEKPDETINKTKPQSNPGDLTAMANDLFSGALPENTKRILEQHNIDEDLYKKICTSIIASHSENGKNPTVKGIQNEFKACSEGGILNREKSRAILNAMQEQNLLKRTANKSEVTVKIVRTPDGKTALESINP